MKSINQVAVRVWLTPEDAAIQAWDLGPAPWKEGHLSQQEWAEMSLPDLYSPEDWYGTHESLDPDKCYELYFEGTMRGSIDHNGEADEEFDWDRAKFRELSVDEMLAMNMISIPEEGKLPVYTTQKKGSGKIHWAHCDTETCCGQPLNAKWSILTNTSDRPATCKQCLAAENFVVYDH